MATEENFSLSLEDLPCDVLSVVLFHLSPPDILSLSTTSRKMFKNVQEAKQLVLKSAQELIKSLSVTDTVTTFIDELDKAIRFGHDVKALKEESQSIHELCDTLDLFTDSYGYEFLGGFPFLQIGPGFHVKGDEGLLPKPSKLAFSLECYEKEFTCRITSNKASVTRDYDHRHTYQFGKSFCLKFKYFLVEEPYGCSHDTHFELSTDATLRELVQVALDINALNRLYQRWEVRIISYVDIGPTGQTGYCLESKRGPVPNDFAHFSIDEVCSPMGLGKVDAKTEIDHTFTFRFLLFLIDNERSE
jgi:hypothetical protein